MKNYLKYGIVAVAFVAVILIAVFGYNYLTSRYTPDEPETQSKNDSSMISDSIEKAPDFEVTDTSGNKVKLSDYFGKPIVINFWATWCGPCKSELPAFNKLYEKNKNEVVFLMVNLTDGYRDTVKSVNKFVSDNKYSFPVYFDTEYSASNAFGVSGIPMTVFIDKSGALYDSHVGMMSELALEDYLIKLTN